MQNFLFFLLRNTGSLSIGLISLLGATCYFGASGSARADGVVLGEFRGTGRMESRLDVGGEDNFTNPNCDIAINIAFNTPYLDYSYSYFCYLGGPVNGPENDSNFRFFVSPQNEIFLVGPDGSLTESPVGVKEGNRFTVALSRSAVVRLRRLPAAVRGRFLEYYNNYCSREETAEVELNEIRRYEFVLNGDAVELYRFNRREHLPMFISQRCRDRFESEGLKYGVEVEHSASLQRYRPD